MVRNAETSGAVVQSYQMVESLLVRNFRCFPALELHGLRRINIIVGPNASGKTALLESLYLAAGVSPELALRLRLWRGMGQGLRISLDRPSYESLWKDLFHSFYQDKTISIELVGSPPNTRSLRISYKQGAVVTLPLDSQPLDATAIVPIVFEWKDHRGANTVEVSITREGLSIGAVGEAMRGAMFSTSLAAGDPGENASRFSEIVKQKRERALIEALRAEFPYIEDISVVMSGGAGTLYAAVDGLPERIAVGMVSGGVNKLLSLLLALASLPQGVVMVDEVENGFYYAALPRLWPVLLRFSREYDAQVFATTHSLESLRALAPCISGNEDDFCLIRMDKKNGECGARVIGGRQLGSAIAEEVEVRGT